MQEAPTIPQLLKKIWVGTEPDTLHVTNLARKFGPWSRPERVAAECHLVISHKLTRFVLLWLNLACAVVQILIGGEYVAEIDTLSFNIFCQIIFTGNVVVRIFTYSYHPPEKASDYGWLAFGCVLTTLLWVPVLVEMEAISSLRVLRLVCALQYLTWIKDLELIMTAFTASFYGIFLLGCLGIISFGFFSIAAVMLFKHADPYKFGTIRVR